MFERMLQRTCVIIRRSEDPDNVNEYGDPEIETDVSDPIPCELQQIRTDEDPSEGEYARTEWTLYLPEGTELDTTDQIVLDEQAYELVGEPEDWIGLNARWGFVEAQVMRTGKVPAGES